MKPDSKTSRETMDSKGTATQELNMLKTDGETQSLRLRETQSISTISAGLIFVGLLFVGAAVFMENYRALSLALGATGLFGGFLSRFLVLSRFDHATLAADVFQQANSDRIVLLSATDREVPTYVPGENGVRLVLSAPPRDKRHQESAGEPPKHEVGEISLNPAGVPFIRAVEGMLGGGYAEEVDSLCEQLVDGLENGLLVAEIGEIDLRTKDNIVTFEVEESVYGLNSNLEHPITSYFGVGLATGLGCPIFVQTQDESNDKLLITCRWEDTE